ncbi:MAG TPA: HigA family addiction module antitoxin [Gemmatimonadota bacterium]|jgi:addiction module HigA family antidote
MTDPSHPGEILKSEFLEPRGMTQTELARRLDVPYQRVNQIINRRRAVTADTALRLARVFGTKPEFWLELQTRWELSQASLPSPTGVRESKPATAPPALLDEIVGRIVDAVDPETIVLFGSAAIGDADSGSDIDLLVVDQEPFGPARSRRGQLKRIRQALAGLGVAKDILLFSVDEVERWRSSPNHIVSRAFRQGRVLYARP